MVLSNKSNTKQTKFNFCYIVSSFGLCRFCLQNFTSFRSQTACEKVKLLFQAYWKALSLSQFSKAENGCNHSYSSLEWNLIMSQKISKLSVSLLPTEVQVRSYWELIFRHSYIYQPTIVTLFTYFQLCNWSRWTSIWLGGLHILKDVRMKWSFTWIRPVIHPSGRPCESTPWKLRGCWLHTIPPLSLTLQLSAHQEWEGNKPGMALHPCPYLDTSSSSMCCLLACWTVHK